MRESVLGVSLLAAAVFAGGCNTYRDELVRAQHVYELQNQHDRTLGLLRNLEGDLNRLSTPEQAEYAYLRGMTDYRMGYRSDARHWLSIAKAHDDASPGLLPTDYKARLTEALDELNGVVYDDGYAALATSHKPGGDEPPVKKPASPPAP
jgi:hypothetical protein